MRRPVTAPAMAPTARQAAAHAVPQDERDEGGERAQEQAAEPVELRAPDPDFPADTGHCALKYREIGHAPSSTP
jgi:hypothetical protein